MLGTKYPNENCSSARTLEVVGERWSLLIVRDALFRNARLFSDFERGLGLATNVLAKRLETLVGEGIFEHAKDTAVTSGGRYVPTPKALDLIPVIIALTEWGDKWAAPDGPPIQYQHAGCGGRVGLDLTCSSCGRSVALGHVMAVPSP